MAWDDIREYTQRQFDIEFDGRVEVRLPDDVLETPAGRRAALEIVEGEAREFCARLAQAVSTARDTLGVYARITKPNDQVIPWLPAGHGRDDAIVLTQPVHPLTRRFDLERSLPGHSIADSWELARFTVSAYRGYETGPIVITATLVQLGDGSLWSVIKGTVKVTFATATLILAALGPVRWEPYENWKFEREIHQVVEGQHCSTLAQWNIDLASLRQLGGEELNYQEEGISPAEGTLRACNLQVMLAVIQGTPFLIDGMPKQQTRNALRHFAEQRGLRADITLPELRGQIVVEFQSAMRRRLE